MLSGGRSWVMLLPLFLHEVPLQVSITISPNKKEIKKKPSREILNTKGTSPFHLKVHGHNYFIFSHSNLKLNTSK